MVPSRRRGRSLIRLVAPWLLLGACGCATTGFHERERLAHAAMQFDEDPAVHYLRVKTESAREGALGGYAATAPGGCGCE